MELRDAALERMTRRSTRNPKAHDTLWRGIAHHQRFTREDNREARYLYEGRLAEAVAAAERAVELAPNFEFPHLILGTALARQGRIAAAMQSVARALRINPKAPSAAWGMVAYVNFSAGRTEKAVELWEQVRAANPDMILARIPLAAIYESEGRHEEARAVVQEILRVNPDLTADHAAQLTVRATPEQTKALRSAGLP